MKDSLELIYSGTPESFIEALCREALEHPAVTHQYLVKLSKGQYPDMIAALADYAYQYSFYSDSFTEYLDAVIQSLSSESHKSSLRENFEEEAGDPESDDLAKKPHKWLFNRFAELVGVNDAYRSEHTACPTVMVWRDLFLQKCQTPQEGVGVGAIGIGTEFVVPKIYGYIIQAIREHTDLGGDAAFFFELHTEADEEHADDLNKILVDLAVTPDAREKIRFGTISTLNLRKAFWDIMLARAERMPSSER